MAKLILVDKRLYGGGQKVRAHELSNRACDQRLACSPSLPTDQTDQTHRHCPQLELV